MKDVVEELKALRNSESKEAPTLEKLETIAEHNFNTENDFELRRSSLLKRMLPEYYATFSYTGPPPIKSLMEETLFYIFYALADSELQILAYNELVNKGYNYSKTLDLFLIITDMKIADNESHVVTVFDRWEWKKINKNVVFTKDFISGLESYVKADSGV